MPDSPALTSATAAASSAAASPAPADDVCRWHTLSGPGRHRPDLERFSPRRLLIQFLAGLSALLILIGGVSALAARALAEREAVSDAADLADVLAEAVIQPSLTADLVRGDPAALAGFDTLVRERVLSRKVVRVKLWDASGRVLYADEPALIGRTFELSAGQQAVLRDPVTQAEISTLEASENAFEDADKLVEVYRPVWFPDRTSALFELYASYDPVGARSTMLWRSFTALTMASLLLLVVLTAPMLWHVLGRLRRGERLRAELSERALEASASERRRIAATLHDGPVQELAATSFAVAGAAAGAAARGESTAAHALEQAAATVRSSIRSLRTLLVDIYPPSLEHSGVVAALTDLAQSGRGDGMTVRLDVEEHLEQRLGTQDARLIFRVAQECLRNAARHAGPAQVPVRLSSDGPQIVLDIVDDGVGFDIGAVVADPAPGHFGLRLLGDLATEAGARLDVASAPGRGTHWRLMLTPTGGPS